MGIQPDFSVWKYFFHALVRLKSLLVAGGVVLQIWNNLSRKYFRLRLATSKKGWHQEWFPGAEL
jgi:hypothetical protein